MGSSSDLSAALLPDLFPRDMLTGQKEEHGVIKIPHIKQNLFF